MVMMVSGTTGRTIGIADHFQAAVVHGCQGFAGSEIARSKTRYHGIGKNGKGGRAERTGDHRLAVMRKDGAGQWFL